MQKRLISMVLALSMALTAMPLPALAQSAPPDTAKAARWVVEAELLPDMGEGAFTPGKRVTKVQVIRAWNRLKKLGLAAFRYFKIGLTACALSVCSLRSHPHSPFCRCVTFSPGAGEVFPQRERQEHCRKLPHYI